MKKVSVIMPAYNHENFIGESIESVLAQTYENIEFLILNDASTDGTRSVIEGYLKANPNMRLIDKPNNGGTVAALNDLIEEATGEFIIWLSSDDLHYPHTVEKLMDCLNCNPGYNISFGGSSTIDKDGNILSETVFRDINDKYFFHKKMLSINMVPGCSIAVKKESYRKAGGFDARFRYAHDYHMWLRLFADNDALYIEEPLFKNRLHDNQVTALGRNWVDAVGVLFDIYQNEAVMKRYLSRIGMEYSEEIIVSFIKRLGSFLIGMGVNEKKEFIYRLDKFMKTTTLSEGIKNTLSLEKRFFNLTVDEKFIEQLAIKESDILSAFNKLAGDLKLDGILINKEAVRLHLIEKTDATSFCKKVMPHSNTLFTAQITHDNLALLRNELMFFNVADDKKDVYKIGLTRYMAEEAAYKGVFHNAAAYDSYILSHVLYRIIIEERLKNA